MSEKTTGHKAEKLPEVTDEKATLATEKEAPHKPAPHHRQKKAQEKTGGSGTAVLALLVALGTAGGGYWLWQAMNKAQSALQSQAESQKAALAELTTEQDRLRRAIDDVNHQLSVLPRTDADLGHRVRNLENDLEQKSAGLESALNTLRREAGQRHGDHSIAEVEYLLVMATQRLQLAADVGGSLQALHMADSRLAALADPRYQSVRNAIATDIQALEGVALPDKGVISQELSAIAGSVMQLPLRGEGAAAPAAPAGASPGETAEKPKLGDWRGMARQVWSDIKSLFTFRRGADRVQPSLPPQERYYLEHNLRLKLESARLALLEGNAAIYQATLNEARQWLNDYFDTGSELTQAQLAKLEQLMMADIAPQLPAIGASLEALRNLPVMPETQQPLPNVPFFAPPADGPAIPEDGITEPRDGEATGEFTLEIPPSGDTPKAPGHIVKPPATDEHPAEHPAIPESTGVPAS